MRERRASTRTERLLTGISLILAVLCVLLAIQIIRSRLRAAPDGGIHLPSSPATSTAWLGQGAAGMTVALYQGEDDAALRSRRDQTLAGALGLDEDAYSFLELTIISDAGEGGETVGVLEGGVTVSLEEGSRQRSGRSVEALLAGGESLLPSGARMLVEQRAARGGVDSGHARRVLVGFEGEVDLHRLDAVRGEVGGQQITFERREYAPGGLDEIIGAFRQSALR